MRPTVGRTQTVGGAAVDNAIGTRIRELRASKGLSVRRLAEMTGVSPSLISHLELGKGTPSVKTLYALVAAFDIPLSAMFETPAERTSRTDAGITLLHPAQTGIQALPLNGERPVRGPVLRGDQRQVIRLENGFEWQRLTPGADSNVEFMETIIDVGEGRPDSEMKTHNGTEYGVVLKGRLGVKIAFDTYILEAHDSIRFESSLPHCLWNAGDEPTHTIWFVCGRSPAGR